MRVQMLKILTQNLVYGKRYLTKYQYNIDFLVNETVKKVKPKALSNDVSKLALPCFRDDLTFVGRQWKEN